MQVSEVGEFGLIELLVQESGLDLGGLGERPRSGVLVDIGDDALVANRRDAAAVWTTDTLVQGVHFLPGTPWRDIGWKALAVNLSDIAAMGGTPDWFLVTVAFPANFEVDDLRQLYAGLSEAARTYSVRLAGGDLVRSPVFSITIALIGTAFAAPLAQPSALTRNAARPGDVVAISGRLGAAAGGLLVLQGQGPRDAALAEELKRAHLRPVPRLSLGRQAVEAGLRCGIDISDGLVQDLGHVALASKVGIRLIAGSVPVDRALAQAFPGQALGLALSGGEDYQLGLVGPSATMDALIDRGLDLTVVGEVVRSENPGVAVIDEDGREIPFALSGWDHFRLS